MTKHLSKILFALFFILALGKGPFGYALGMVLGAFTPYWIIVLITSLVKSNSKKTKFKWVSNNYILIIPLIIFLFGILGNH